MHNKKTIPFELALTAIALFQLRQSRPGIPVLNEPADYFNQAKALLDGAANFLEKPQENAQANILERLGNANAKLYFRAGKPAPFDMLLQPIRSEKRGTGKHSKKVRTLVGAITTLDGLEKAIRRYLPKADAARIIRAKAMKENEWKSLVQAQKTAIQARAEKRVKGGNSEKSQLG